MRRRDFISGLGAAAAWNECVHAQNVVGRPLIAVFLGNSESNTPSFRAAFLDGLEKLGYSEGRNIFVTYRHADGDLTRLAAIANELIRLKPDVIVVGPSVIALAAMRADPTVPIVAVALTDPIGQGLVASYARPGRSITGILFQLDTLPQKQLEIARELVPGASTIGVLGNARNESDAVLTGTAIASAASSLGVKVIAENVGTAAELGTAFETFVRGSARFIIVAQDPMLLNERVKIAALALEARLPTIFLFREHMDAGGLISYGADLRDSFRRVARYVDQILKGEKAADLPVEFPTKMEMIVNLKTANALNMSIPESFLVRADEVIE